jgi:hypothetical protein
LVFEEKKKKKVRGYRIYLFFQQEIHDPKSEKTFKY